MKMLYISAIICFYMFVCICVLVFNIIYIFNTRSIDNRKPKDIKLWNKTIFNINEEKDVKLLNKKKKNLKMKLESINNVVTFSITIQEGLPQKQYILFLNNNIDVLRDIAIFYEKKNPMEKAYVAYVIAQCMPYISQEDRNSFCEIFIKYLEKSTVYCRENVLNALYASGNSIAIEHAFNLMNEYNFYHSTKLLSDGLVKFHGDKKLLADRLWSHNVNWNDNIRIAIVLFITQVTELYGNIFSECLKKSEYAGEVKYAMMRYYYNHPMEEMQDYFIQCVENGVEYEDKIVACFVLGSYCNDKVKKVLINQLSSANWYVRKNSAQSLIKMNLSVDDIRDIYHLSDNYGKEILNYTFKNITGKDICYDNIC